MLEDAKRELAEVSEKIFGCVTEDLKAREQEKNRIATYEKNITKLLEEYDILWKKKSELVGLIRKLR